MTSGGDNYTALPSSSVASGSTYLDLGRSLSPTTNGGGEYNTGNVVNFDAPTAHVYGANGGTPTETQQVESEYTKVSFLNLK